MFLCALVLWPQQCWSATWPPGCCACVPGWLGFDDDFLLDKSSPWLPCLLLLPSAADCCCWVLLPCRCRPTSAMLPGTATPTYWGSASWASGRRTATAQTSTPCAGGWGRLPPLLPRANSTGGALLDIVCPGVCVFMCQCFARELFTVLTCFDKLHRVEGRC